MTSSLVGVADAHAFAGRPHAASFCHRDFRPAGDRRRSRRADASTAKSRERDWCQEQPGGESKARPQGSDVDRGPGLPSDNTSEQQQLRRSATGQVSLSPEQREKIRNYFAHSSAPREENVNLSISVGASVPRQTPTHDFPQELEQAVPAWRGTLYVRVRDQLVVIDRDTRRIVAIVPGV